MFYAFEQEVPIKEDVYRKIMERMGPEPLAGQIVHLVARSGDGTLRYVDVWASREACERAFKERIHPAVSAVFREIGFRVDDGRAQVGEGGLIHRDQTPVTERHGRIRKVGVREDVEKVG